MKRHPPWILALLLGFLALFIPAAICSANTGTAIAQTVYVNDVQFTTIASDALTATGTLTAVDVSSDAIIIGSTAKNTRDAASWADGFPAITAKTDAGTIELTIINITAEESSWIAEQNFAVTVGSEGRAHAPSDVVLLVVLDFGFTSSCLDNPTQASTAWEAQGRANAQIPTTLNNGTDQNTTANNCDDFAVTAAPLSDQANIANGRSVGSEETINSKSLYQNPRPEVQYNVILPIHGLTRA